METINQSIEVVEASATLLPEVSAVSGAAEPPLLPASTIIIEATPDEEDPSPGSAFTSPTPGHLPPSPLEALPPTAQNLLLESARVFGDLPLEVPMVSFMAFLSGCVGRSVILEVKPGCMAWVMAEGLWVKTRSPCPFGLAFKNRSISSARGDSGVVRVSPFLVT